jgi:hypothetical protein
LRNVILPKLGNVCLSYIHTCRQTEYWMNDEWHV